MVPLHAINERRTPYDHLDVNEAWAKRSLTSVVVKSPYPQQAMTKAELLDRWQHLPGGKKKRAVKHVQKRLFDWRKCKEQV